MLTNTNTLLGRTIAGYHLLHLLGQGGMGAVFLGQYSEEPEIQAAIKVLLPFKYTLPEILISFQARFIREAQAMNQLEHAHIVPMLDYGEIDGLPYIVMPYVSGGTLDTRLSMLQEPLPLSEIARYVQQLASALDYAHQHGIVHRDIKPANVLLDVDDNVYLTDFGIARLFESVPDTLDKAPTSLTSAGEVFGTPSYMAPELFRGEAAGPQSDIYALGIMLYRLVSGRVPFQGIGPFDMGIKHLSEEPQPPSELRPELPAAAEATILCALAKFPSGRFTSAGALAHSFELGIKGEWTDEVLTLWTQSSQAPTQLIATTQFSTPPLEPPAAQEASIPAVHPAAHRGRIMLAGFVIMWIMLLAIAAGIVTGNRSFYSPLSSSALGNYAQTLPTKITTRPHVRLTATATRSPSSPPASSSGTQTSKNFTIAYNNNQVYAVRSDNNALLWSDETNGSIIPPLDIIGHTIYVVTWHGQVYALHTTDGAQFWSYASDSHTAAPLKISNGIVFLYTTNGNTYELQASNGALIAILPPSQHETPTPHTDPTPIPTHGITPTPTITPTPSITPTPTQQPTPTPTSGPNPTPTPTSGETTPTPEPTSPTQPSPSARPISAYFSTPGRSHIM